MMGKKVMALKKLTNKAKAGGGAEAGGVACHECLLKKHAESSPTPTNKSTPAGFFPVYVGDERQRFVVPTSYLSHPLFKILLEKTYDEFGFQHSGLVVPCTVSTFQEVINAVECSHGKFDLSHILNEF